MLFALYCIPDAHPAEKYKIMKQIDVENFAIWGGTSEDVDFYLIQYDDDVLLKVKNRRSETIILRFCRVVENECRSLVNQLVLGKPGDTMLKNKKIVIIESDFLDKGKLSKDDVYGFVGMKATEPARVAKEETVQLLKGVGDAIAAAINGKNNVPKINPSEDKTKPQPIFNFFFKLE